MVCFHWDKKSFHLGAKVPALLVALYLAEGQALVQQHLALLVELYLAVGQALVQESMHRRHSQALNQLGTLHHRKVKRF